jgi:hypothetical protein
MESDGEYGGGGEYGRGWGIWKEIRKYGEVWGIRRVRRNMKREY